MTRGQPTRLWTLSCPLILLAAGCVTINLYFPEAEIRDAADRIVEEVRPDIEAESACTTPEAGTPWSALVATAHAAEKSSKKKKLDTASTSDVVKRILGQLKKRFKKLIPYFRKGAIGEGRDGYLALRDVKALNLKERRDVKALVAAENKDRKNLYAEIARLNKVDNARIKDVGSIFAEKWQEKCEPNWWIQPKKKWVRKKAKKKKGKGKKADA